MNAVEIEEAVSALAERPFDPQEFPFSFLEAFGNRNLLQSYLDDRPQKDPIFARYCFIERHSVARSGRHGGGLAVAHRRGAVEPIAHE